VRAPKIVIGIPTGWHLAYQWVAWWLDWSSGPHPGSEVAVLFEASNTKACAYSNIIESAKADRDLTHLVILETNHVLQVPIDRFVRRIQQFHCALSPTRFTDNSIGTDAIFHEDTSTLPTEDVERQEGLNNGRELAPWECRFGATGVVSMDRAVVHSLKPRFTWEIKSRSKVLTRDLLVYCYDGDTWPDHPDPEISKPDAGNPVRRLAIEQSLYSSVRAGGFGVWADPQLYSVNLRLGGSYPSLRLGDLPER